MSGDTGAAKVAVAAVTAVKMDRNETMVAMLLRSSDRCSLARGVAVARDIVLSLAVRKNGIIESQQ